MPVTLMDDYADGRRGPCFARFDSARLNCSQVESTSNRIEGLLDYLLDEKIHDRKIGLPPFERDGSIAISVIIPGTGQVFGVAVHSLLAAFIPGMMIAPQRGAEWISGSAPEHGRANQRRIGDRRQTSDPGEDRLLDCALATVGNSERGRNGRAFQSQCCDRFDALKLVTYRCCLARNGHTSITGIERIAEQIPLWNNEPE